MTRLIQILFLMVLLVCFPITADADPDTGRVLVLGE